MCSVVFGLFKGIDMIKAYHNEDLVDEDGTRPFGVEIYDDDDKMEREFEFYPTIDEANSRISEINSLSFETSKKITEYKEKKC